MIGMLPILHIVMAPGDSVSDSHVILDISGCPMQDEVDVGIQSTVSRNSTQPGNPTKLHRIESSSVSQF